MPANDEQPDPIADRSRDGEADGDDPNPLAKLRASAESETSRLQRGPTVSILGASLPARVLMALGVFVLVFMLVLMALWGLLGGIGLALGWIPAAVVALLAIQLVGRSVWAQRE